jgi:hypothetical protein
MCRDCWNRKQIPEWEHEWLSQDMENVISSSQSQPSKGKQQQHPGFSIECFISVSTKMAEALLAEGNTDWGDEVDAVRPLDEQKPHSGTWEERDEVPSRLGEDLIMEEQVEVVGNAQVTATVESTVDLAVSPEQVKQHLPVYHQTSV